MNTDSSSWTPIIIACVFFLATFSQDAVNSYLTSYTKELGFGNVGLFFTITAVVTLISRFFSAELQKRIGLSKMSFALSLMLAASIFAIPYVRSMLQLFLLAVPYGLSVGLLFPIFNYRIIRTVDQSRFAFATSVYYCGLDIGYGVGAVIWGYVIQLADYRALFIIASIIVILMGILDQVVMKKEAD